MLFLPSRSGPRSASFRRVNLSDRPRAKCRSRHFALEWNGHGVQGSAPAAPRAAVWTFCAARLSGSPDISRSLSFVAELSYLFQYKSSELARIEMDFSLTPKTEELRKRVSAFMDQHVLPIEKDVQRAMGESGNEEPQSLKDVRKKAKAEGLWNLFLPDEKFGAGLKNYEYAPLCELMGHSQIGARAFNCMAPDTGNMEILTEFGTPEQKKKWLQPCLDGEIRTCFSMTEPDTPGSDPTQLKTRAVRDADDSFTTGHKCFHPNSIGSTFAIAMVVTDPDAEPHPPPTQTIVPTIPPAS